MNTPPTTEPSQVVPAASKFYPTFFLCLFLGVFGVHRFYTGKIKSGVAQLLTFGGLGIWWFIDMVIILLGKFKDKNGVAMANLSPKVTWGVFIVVVIIGLASGGGNSDSRTSSTDRQNESSSIDPDPTGTCTAGDKNSVYSRLTIDSSGTFSFETVDFTGDVKGGYSGTWETKGKSVRFEWGSGGADSGSCSGRRTGSRTLVFGSTTFHK